VARGIGSADTFRSHGCSDYPSSSNNIGSNPNVVSQYCNGCASHRNAPRRMDALGRAATTCLRASRMRSCPTGLQPHAGRDVDEGNNWINMTWGPTDADHPSINAGNPASYGGGPRLGKLRAVGDFAGQSISSGRRGQQLSASRTSSAIRGRMHRPTRFDVGAVEFQGAGGGGGPGTATVGFSGRHPR